MLNNKPLVKISADADSVMLELNGPLYDVLAVGTTGYARFVEACAEKLDKPGAMQKIYRTAIDILEQKLETLTGKPRKRCTCQAAAKPEEPAKRMTPEELNAFVDAWVSQATLEEKAALLIASCSSHRREQGSSL